jgi:hypothetical protein
MSVRDLRTAIQDSRRTFEHAQHRVLPPRAATLTASVNASDFPPTVSITTSISGPTPWTSPRSSRIRGWHRGPRPTLADAVPRGNEHFARARLAPRVLTKSTSAGAEHRHAIAQRDARRAPRAPQPSARRAHDVLVQIRRRYMQTIGRHAQVFIVPPRGDAKQAMLATIAMSVALVTMATS